MFVKCTLNIFECESVSANTLIVLINVHTCTIRMCGYNNTYIACMHFISIQDYIRTLTESRIQPLDKHTIVILCRSKTCVLLRCYCINSSQMTHTSERHNNDNNKSKENDLAYVFHPGG